MLQWEDYLIGLLMQNPGISLLSNVTIILIHRAAREGNL